MNERGKLRLEYAARMAYQANVSFSRGVSAAIFPSWEAALTWRKDQYRKTVKEVLADPDITPEEMHEAWRERMTLAGWSYYTVRNEAAKQNPAMRPWNQLEEQQQKRVAIILQAVIGALDEFCSFGDQAVIEGPEKKDCE